MTLSTLLSYWSGLAFVGPELPGPTLVGTMLILHICDAIMCRLLAHNTGTTDRPLDGHRVRGRALGRCPAPAPPEPRRRDGARRLTPLPSASTHAVAVSRVCVRLTSQRSMPRRPASSAARPCRRSPGRRRASTHHLDVVPADAVAPARAERLHRRLLGGETRGVALGARPAPRLAVACSAGREDPGAKAVAVRRGERAAHALDLAGVDADPDDHRVPVSTRRSCGRCACRTAASAPPRWALRRSARRYRLSTA